MIDGPDNQRPDEWISTSFFYAGNTSTVLTKLTRDAIFGSGLRFPKVFYL